MGVYADLINSAMRDFRVDGDPSSGMYHPPKKTVREAFAALADATDNVQAKVVEARQWAELADSDGNATIALEARRGAEVAETGAITAKNLAESARDAAFVNADVYADIATALADIGLAAGEQFQVASSDGNRVRRYRKDSTTAATFLVDYPRADAIPIESVGYDEDIEVLTDAIGQVIRRTDTDGDLHLPNMRGRSVQRAYEEHRNAGSERSGFRSGDVLQVEDDAGRITLRQDASGGVFIPGVPGSIQSALGYPVDRHVKYPTDDREKHHALIRPMVEELVVDGREFIPPPRGLVPNRYFVPDTIVSAFSVDQPPEDRGLWLESPHHPGGLVHPYLLEMRRPIQGYRYLFGDTPHFTEKEENPCLWGTNDLRNFDLLPGVQQPLGQPPMGPNSQWNADISFTYDPRNGELICHWIGSDNAGAGYDHYRSTWNGLDWTDELWVPYAPSPTVLSPAILYDPVAGLWRKWGIVTEGIIDHYTGPDYFGPWTLVNQTDPRPKFIPWHTEVKYIGNKFVMCVNQRNDGANLWLGISADGSNWTFGSALINLPGPVYKGTFEVDWDGDNLRLFLGWNAYKFPKDPAYHQYLYLEPTNWVNTTAI